MRQLRFEVQSSRVYVPQLLMLLLTQMLPFQLLLSLSSVSALPTESPRKLPETETTN